VAVVEMLVTVDQVAVADMFPTSRGKPSQSVVVAPE
jgi:hypothetical protein